MALVAYSDDSDLESDREEDLQNPLVISKSIEKEVPKESNRSNGLPTSVRESISKSLVSNFPNNKVAENEDTRQETAIERKTDEINYTEDDEGSATSNKGSLLASIPAAKPVTLGDFRGSEKDGEEEDELTDVPTVDTWKITQALKNEKRQSEGIRNPRPTTTTNSSAHKKKEKRKIQFLVPALSEFADDDDEEEEIEEKPERKRLKPSSKGTGLFSVLPEPKHLSVKETKRFLVPHVLTKAPPPTKKPVKQKQKPESKVLEENESDGDEDEKTEGACDFFALSDAATNVSKLPALPQSFTAPSAVLPKHDVESEAYKSSEYAANYGEAGSSDGVTHYHSLHNAQDETLYSGSQPADTSAIDEEAMLRLTGKRRGKGEVISFINVSADDVLLNREEWMNKALTEEKPTHGFSKKREGLPSQKQKQKHQITFLAHQAKEREIELKNNWAQNRMTKMQTQAKYGF